MKSIYLSKIISIRNTTGNIYSHMHYDNIPPIVKLLRNIKQDYKIEKTMLDDVSMMIGLLDLNV